MLKAARLGERYSDRTLNPGEGMASARVDSIELWIVSQQSARDRDAAIDRR
jgi:hypothetical protein